MFRLGKLIGQAMKRWGGLLAFLLTLSTISYSAAMRGYIERPAQRVASAPSRYPYARRPIYTPRRAVVAPFRQIVRVAPARRVYNAKTFPLSVKYSQGARSRAQVSAESCPRIYSADMRRVTTVALGRINSVLAQAYMVKNLQRGNVQICSKCVGHSCIYDHNSVKLTMSLAHVCTSGDCVCGVERYGRQNTCEVSGWTKPGHAPYNLEIECNGKRVWPPRGLVVPAKRIQTSPRITPRPRISTTSVTKSSTAATTTTATAEVTTSTTFTAPGAEQIPTEDFDASAEGPSASERPAPIILWDETTSKATVVYPDPLLNGESDKDIEEEELLQ